jgi:hypothetical protein
MRTRVFIEDARRDGGFLRVTWHPEARQFVISNWEDSVCVGATRVPLEGAPELVALLVDGIADAAQPRTAVTPVPRTLREHLHAWWRGRAPQAQVLPFRRR